MRISVRLRISPQVWTRFAPLFLVGLGSNFVAAQSAEPPAPDTVSGHPRAVIISDISGDPDDQMSLVRLLVYSQEAPHAMLAD